MAIREHFRIQEPDSKLDGIFNSYQYVKNATMISRIELKNNHTQVE